MSKISPKYMFILILQTDVSVQSPWYNLPVPHLEL